MDSAAAEERVTYTWHAMSDLSAAFRVAGRSIGSGDEVLIIAEAGVNHNGEVSLAHELVDAAADAGADAVKFQTFSAEKVAASSARTAEYQAEAGQGEHQIEMLRRLELPRSAWSELQQHARDRDLVFLSTAFDDDSLKLLIALGVDALKVPSGELNNLRFLEAHAASPLPLIVSTGMATTAEVDWALTLLAPRLPDVALLHCVSAYPAPLDACNLRAIPAMADRYDVIVGWSDHTVGNDAAVVAATLGARLFEKHLTLDQSMTGPDHQASAAPRDFAGYVEAIRGAIRALGNGEKLPADLEVPMRKLARRSHHVVRDLPAGHILATSDTVLLRPATGIDPARAIAGEVLARPIAAGSPIREADLR